MSELACLEVAVLLWLVHVLLQANLTGASPSYLFSSRDDPPPPASMIGGRAARAARNYIDNFPPFAALDLAFLATNHPAGIWPTLWIVARIAYLPLYLFNGIYARTTAWLISIIALAAMLIRLAL
jgi:uncharacterized MAPEG superfamily protein